MFDPYHDICVLMLSGTERPLFFPILIDKTNAYSIGLTLQGVLTPRPLTHDLMKSVLDTLNAKVISIVISDLRKEAAYSSRIHLYYRDSEYAIPAPYGDAISIALRADAPIFISEHTIKQRSADALDQWLEQLKPEDFGKYNA